MEKDMVSILTPCYNSARFIHRLIESVLIQEYRPMEFIIIDDGSTDATYQVIMSYHKLFIEQGIELNYIYKKHEGIAPAINRGLEIFRGEYLIWPDSDDFFTLNSIRKRVEFLKKHPEYEIVACRGWYVDEEDVGTKIKRFGRVPKPDSEDDLFKDLILARNSFPVAGVYMVRSKAFLEFYPDRHIFDGQTGRNWQMLLPVASRYKCGYINRALYYIVRRKDSYGRRKRTIEEIREKKENNIRTLKHVISSLHLANEEEYLQLLSKKKGKNK